MDGFFTDEQATEIRAAVLRPVQPGTIWESVSGLTVAGLHSGRARPRTRRGGRPLTATQVAAITAAVRRETSGVTWADISHLDLAGMCSMTQDALIDDLWEDHPDDRPHRAEMTAAIRIYDELLGTRRAATDLPPHPKDT